MCHLDVRNAVDAIKTSAKWFRNQLVHLYCDSEIAVTIFQVGHGRDPFIQVCAWQFWLACTHNDITLAVGDIAGELLISYANALSHWHMSNQYKDCVNILIKDKGVNIISVSPGAFVLSSSL